MLYGAIKILARLAIRFYCRDITINKKELLKLNGPLLLAVNHPNSFLDAIILCTLFDKPVYSLARGDSFKNKLAAKLLVKLKMYPVYRVSEGVENLEENYKTFDICKEIFKKNGIVLIFIEGRCINEWHLRPLKKGTARLAISSWEEGIPLNVLPVAINYNSFSKFGKNIKLFFGELITPHTINLNDGHGKAIKAFNANAESQLKQFVFEIDKNNKPEFHKLFYVQQSYLKRVLLFVPALLGLLLHAPIYLVLKFLNKKIVKEEGHFDSVMVAILLLTYPLLMVSLTFFTYYFYGSIAALCTFILVPFGAWAYVQVKPQLD